MQLRPILASLRHHKLTAGLLMLQVAFTCAILVNALPMVSARIARVTVASGFDEARLSVISYVDVEPGGNAQAEHATDLDALRRIPGVESVVSLGGGLPFTGDVNAYGLCPSLDAKNKAKNVQTEQQFAQLGCQQPDVFNGSPGFMQTAGLRLVEGHDFAPGDYTTGDVPAAILTRSLADTFYPHQSAIGQTLFKGDHEIRVIGVVDDVLRPILHGTPADRLVIFWPQLPDDNAGTYLLRTAPQDRRKVLLTARQALAKVKSHRLFPAAQQKTLTDIRHSYFQRDITMIGMLVASGLGLLFVTALGIAGLANFWVQQRRRTIGVRRAVGATRGDILRYFQTENFLIVGAGIVLGLVLGVVCNLLLMHQYELPRLPWIYLPISAVAMALLGQLAVLHPALRAAAVPPVVAIRSV
jgi:putative ABC transport system permease protein